MKHTRLGFLAAVAVTAAASFNADAADHDRTQSGFGELDHVFLIMMENETNTNILNNPNAPFINAYAKVANQATQYFAVGHPSAPNYLEIVGGSNFGLTSDYWPDWAGTGCIDNSPGSTGCVNALPPIAVAGLDNAVVATATKSTDCNGQVRLNGGAPAANNCALRNYPAAPFTPRSIADQLVARSKSWKSYQESLPTVKPGVFGVNYSDGEFSNLSPVSVFGPGPVQKLYAVKHNPFAYFQNIETGANDDLSLGRVVDFDGTDGLWADLESGERTPNFSFIVPNQCHDMHGGVSGGTPICSTGTAAESGFVMSQGDAEVAKLVNGIKASKAWKQGRNAIVLVWDENDYSNAANRVVFLVETNYARNGAVSNTPYDHFSLLRTLEAGFGLPCLNHACDSTSLVMNDLFGGR
jgi:phosphatidylinositol-3-phosphatase